MAAPARILIVDDEPFNRDVLAQELELLDHEAVPAVNGRDALERLARRDLRSDPARHHDAGDRRLRGAAPPQGRRPAAPHPGDHDLGARRRRQRGALRRARRRRLPAQAVRPGAAQGAARRLPREEALARPGGRVSRADRAPDGGDRARAGARRSPAARDPAALGGRRAQGARLRDAEALRAGRGAVRRHRELHAVLRAAPGRGGGGQPRPV